LGQTPTWATTGTDVGYTYDGNTERGKVDYPSNIQYWINYLTALGTRYKGKIHYWEVWNEPGDPGYWAGTVQQMVTLTQVANSVLKGIDPSNQIMAPPDTTNPTRFLPAYLAAGGAANCDIIPYHYYTSAYTPNYPEQIIPQIGGVLQVMTSAGVYKPRWNTEQGWLGATPVISNTTAAAYVARTYLLNWPYGIQSANWFSWGYSTVEGINLTGTNNVTLSPAGIALSNVENWLLGATMTAITTDTNGTWQATITRPGGYQGEIIWNPSTAVAAYPVPNAWGVTQERKIDGTLVTFINISSIPVSTSPVILENQPALEATTGIAIGTGSNSTTLGGSVAPDGLATTYYFQYGPTTAYGFTTTGRTAVSSNPTSAALCNTVLSGLTPATTYHFQFVAANISGTNYGADQTFTTPPVAPTGLSGTAGNGQVILAWTPSTGATGYNVKRSLTSGGSYGNVGSSIATASYTDTGVTNDTTYYYVVSALDATAESTNSGQVSARPSAPITAAESAPPGVAVTGSNVQLTIGSVVAGHTYQLQYTNSLVPVPAQWTNLGAPQQSPISGTLILTDTTAYESGVPARFYRVSIQQ
jgi:hypothetical protein